MSTLLDSNVLIALNIGDHVFNTSAVTWFTASDEPFATCPITEGALIRHLMRSDWQADDALNLLALVWQSLRHEFWIDDVPYKQVHMRGVTGHRQVTDGYLAQLARQRKGRVATFDRGFAALHKDVAELVPTT